MARLLIAALLLAATANARTLVCGDKHGNVFERPWVGQVGGKPLSCCVYDARGFYPSPGAGQLQSTSPPSLDKISADAGEDR